MTTLEDRFTDLYSAFNARDIDALRESMAPDVDWPNGMEGGRVHGHAAVREYWTRQWKLIDPTVEPVRVTTDDTGKVVVDVHQVVRDLEGKVLMDQNIQHIYTLRDGIIVHMEIVS